MADGPKLSWQAELLLLIMASQGGSMTREAAEAEFARVVALPSDARRAWMRDAQAKARTFAALRRAVNDL